MDTRQVISLSFGDGRFVNATMTGRGGMGAVYRAFDRRLEREVAIKVLDAPDAPPEARLADRFLAEARAVARISHPSVVQVFDVGDGPPPHIVMEWVEGETLDKMVRDGALDPSVAARIVRDVARGLAHAHILNVIHRDVKPGNIIVDSKGAPKIIDFGIAKVKLADLNLTRANIVVGTPNYVAPEQIRGVPIDGRADQYALGITLYHLLRGRAPFDDKTADEIFRHHVQTPLPELAEIEARCGKKLVSILRRMAAKDRELRFPDCGAVATALDDWLSSQEGAKGRDSGTAATAADGSPRLKARAMFRTGRVGVAVIAIAAGIGAFLLLANSEPTRSPSSPPTPESPRAEGNTPEHSAAVAPRDARDIPRGTATHAAPIRAFVTAIAQGSASDLGTLVKSEIESAVIATGRIHVVEREHLDALFKEKQLSRSAEFDRATALKLGQLVAARVVILSRLLTERNAVTVVIHAVDVHTGVLLAEETRDWRPSAGWAGAGRAIVRDATTRVVSRTLAALAIASRQ